MRQSWQCTRGRGMCTLAHLNGEAVVNEIHGNELLHSQN